MSIRAIVVATGRSRSRDFLLGFNPYPRHAALPRIPSYTRGKFWFQEFRNLSVVFRSHKDDREGLMYRIGRFKKRCIISNRTMDPESKYIRNKYTKNCISGFALAKGLIRGLHNRYPNPSTVNYTHPELTTTVGIYICRLLYVYRAKRSVGLRPSLWPGFV